MATSYRIDAGQGTVYADLEDSIGEKELLRYAQLLINDSAFSPSFDQVVDLRRVTAFAESSDAARTVGLFDPFSTNSRWSFVVKSQFQYGLLRMFIGQAGLDHDHGLFFDPTEARAWLGLEAATRPTHAPA